MVLIDEFLTLSARFTLGFRGKGDQVLPVIPAHRRRCILCAARLRRVRGRSQGKRGLYQAYRRRWYPLLLIYCVLGIAEPYQAHPQSKKPYQVYRCRRYPLLLIYCVLGIADLIKRIVAVGIPCYLFIVY